MRTDALFSREIDGIVTHASARFVTPPQDVNAANDLNLSDIIRDLNLAVDNFNRRGSGYILERVTRVILCICKHRPLRGYGTFVATPTYLRNKRCILNVKCSGNRCFVWAVLASLYPQKNNSNRVSSYKKYLDTLNLDGLQFPMHLKDIAKFEQQNPSISVDCLYFDEDSKDCTVEYLSPERGREKHVNLLLLDDNTNPHFVCVSNMSRLVCSRRKRKSSVFVCNVCLTQFSSQNALDKHIPLCLKHAP